MTEYERRRKLLAPYDARNRFAERALISRIPVSRKEESDPVFTYTTFTFDDGTQCQEVNVHSEDDGLVWTLSGGVYNAVLSNQAYIGQLNAQFGPQTIAPKWQRVDTQLDISITPPTEEINLTELVTTTERLVLGYKIGIGIIAVLTLALGLKIFL